MKYRICRGAGLLSAQVIPIWEALHPAETTTSCRSLGGRGNTDFASETAAVSGDNVRSVQRHIARAEALGDDLPRVTGTSLDKGVELDF